MEKAGFTISGTEDTTEESSESTRPLRPEWLHDFCDDLTGIFNCPRSNFHQPFVPHPDPAIQDCTAIYEWLNAFEMAPVEHSKPGSLLTAQLRGQPSGILDITANSVMTKKNMQAQSAFEIALIASVNPNMKSKSLTVEGSKQDKMLLSYAAHKVGLNVENPVDLAELPQEHIQQLEDAWSNFYQTMTNLGHAACEHSKEQFVQQKIENPLEPEVEAALGKNIDPKTYAKAKEEVINSGKASQSALCKIFEENGSKIGHGRAARVQEAMRLEGLIYRNEKRAGHLVCYDQNCNWQVPA